MFSDIKIRVFRFIARAKLERLQRQEDRARAEFHGGRTDFWAQLDGILEKYPAAEKRVADLEMDYLARKAFGGIAA